MFYIVNESLSILENAVLLGVPVPKGRKGRHQNRFYQAMTSCPVSVTST